MPSRAQFKSARVLVWSARAAGCLRAVQQRGLPCCRIAVAWVAVLQVGGGVGCRAAMRGDVGCPAADEWWHG